MSIKRKLTLMMMSISLAAVLLTVMAITVYLIYDMRLGKIQELEVTAALTGDRNSAALMFLDAERAQRNLEIFRLNNSVAAACVYDAKGVLFASYQAEGQKLMITCPSITGNVAKIIEGVLTAFHPITQNNETIGYVYLAADTREINAYVSKIVQISLIAFLMVFIVTLLLTVYFQRAISGPILELAAIAEAVTERNDYTLEATAMYPDETGILARAFNAMLGEVRKRDAELMQANETLEQKVVQRTAQLDIAKRKAEAASEAKSAFLRNMSHEFRTPLHALISFSTYGLREYETAERYQLKQYFEMMQKGSERLCKLVNEVLDLARLEHGEHVFLLKRGDMRDVVTKAGELMHSLAAEKNITVITDFERDLEPVVFDHDKIAQVVTNLLGNALKFTPGGKTIILRIENECRSGSKQLQVSVVDEGIGIPEEEKEMIFESFRQSSRTNTGAGGTGLGLAICRSIIEAHGGKIWAENNTQGPGAKVNFSIPAAIEEGSRIVTMHVKETHHENAA